MVLCAKSTNLRNCSLNFRNNCVFKNVTMSNIECLTIGWCSMSELFFLLIHTTKLRKLNIRYLCNYDYRTLGETHLMINSLNVFLYFVPFNNVELLLKYLPKLKKLTIKGQLDDFNYTDSQLWQTLLTSSLPLLALFSLEITILTRISDTQDIVDKFQTDFWIQRWNLTIDCRYHKSLILVVNGKQKINEQQSLSNEIQESSSES
ncbi:unnamed protein product [Didymodactylos carnosus]|uniref:Uncharacterized protein n=1 Tax=Didymodactylos carnosus TaxID=1234261 RepID=A0A814U8B5_9BILA|nr:unnamed protein product [Didymodactylos carnosus]CAF3935098.1 unnamed protein product [Didymodactylos carnosus]